MGLDVSLHTRPRLLETEPRIYVKQDGHFQVYTADDWRRLYPTVVPPEPLVIRQLVSATLFTLDITHNLGAMAEIAELYTPLWHPEKLIAPNHEAWALIPHLQRGLSLLAERVVRCRECTPPNGWGSYEGLQSFTSRYLQACREYPEAIVRASR